MITQKMLVLSSFKPGDLTGKFGLGFKSVLLTSDRPRLLSGRCERKLWAVSCQNTDDDAQAAANWLEVKPRIAPIEGTLTEIEPHQPAVTAQSAERQIWPACCACLATPYGAW